MKTTLEVVVESCTYNQNPQTSDITYSLLNRTGKNSFKELHYPVKCREYFGDSLVMAVADKDLPSIYGFRLINKRQALDETIFSVTLPTYDQNSIRVYDFFVNQLKYLRKIEKGMGIPLKERSKFYEIDKSFNDYRKIVVVSPKEWQSSPLLISIYTLILRLFTYILHDDKMITLKKRMDSIADISGGVDGTYCTQVKPIDIQFILNNYKAILGENPMTGLNDDVILDKVSSYSTDDLVNFIKEIDNKEITINYSIANNHSQHGLVSFVDRVKYHNNHDCPAFILRSVGIEWSINYCKLKGLGV